MKKKRITVSLHPWQVKKLDDMVRKFWPSLKPARCRAAGLEILLNAADARSGTYDVRFRKGAR